MTSTKPKLLIDVGKLKHPNNGLDTFLRSYLSQLESLPQSEEFDIHLLTPSAGIPDFKTKFNCIKQSKLKHLQARFLVKQFDLWHSPFHSSNKVSKNPHCIHVATIHDFNPLYERPNKKDRYLKRSLNHIIHTDHLVCISQFTQQELKTHHPSLSHIPRKVIYNGVCETQPGEKPTFDVPQRFLFSLGAFMKKKNYAAIIEMMPFIDNDIHLIIAGSSSGSYIDQLTQQVIKLNLTKRVHLIQNISNNDKNWLLDNCEAFLFPSILEGFGLPPVEAMKHGKTAFIFNQTSLPEVVGDAGVIWHDDSPQSMATEVVKFLASDQHNSPEQINQIKQHAAQFCWKRMTLSYLDLFTQLLQSSPHKK
ncbi:MAG: glycosyltransferase family 4 protein [Akkermansiaceae bacterium]